MIFKEYVEIWWFYCEISFLFVYLYFFFCKKFDLIMINCRDKKENSS